MNRPYEAAVELVHYFGTVRQVGHTTRMLEGVNANTIIVTHDQAFADMLDQKTDATCVSLSSLPSGKLRGCNKPLVLDNAATMVLLSDLISVIAGLKDEIKDLREDNAKHRMTIEMVKMIISK